MSNVLVDVPPPPTGYIQGTMYYVTRLDDGRYMVSWCSEED